MGRFSALFDPVCRLLPPSLPVIDLRQCSIYVLIKLMEQIDMNRVAETILAAPGWARVGITAPAPHIRSDAAQELARAVVAAIEKHDPDAKSADQPALPL